MLIHSSNRQLKHLILLISVSPRKHYGASIGHSTVTDRKNYRRTGKERKKILETSVFCSSCKFIFQ